MAEAQGWLGEALRLAGGRYTVAKAAYDKALELGSEPVGASELPAQQQALARVRYNRGILLADHAGQDGATMAAAEADLREAIRLLESLPAQDPPLGAQDLGRAYNNLGSVVALEDGRIAEVRDLYTHAVQIHEDLTRRDPANREYAMELVKFYNNLSATLRDNAEPQEAARRNGQARDRIELLARPAPSVGIERADTYNLRGWITAERAPADAAAAYRRSLDLFAALGRDGGTSRFQEFHERFGDLLVNLAGVATTPALATLLDEGLGEYVAVAERAASGGTPADARYVLDTMARVQGALRGRAAATFDAALNRLRPVLTARTTSTADPPPGADSGALERRPGP